MAVRLSPVLGSLGPSVPPVSGQLPVRLGHGHGAVLRRRAAGHPRGHPTGNCLPPPGTQLHPEHPRDRLQGPAPPAGPVPVPQPNRLAGLRGPAAPGPRAAPAGPLSQPAEAGQQGGVWLHPGKDAPLPQPLAL